MAEKKDNIIKKTGKFFKEAFHDMAEDARAQHQVDKANLEAVKAESKATWEENQGRVTLQKAKESAKKSWDDAHMTPSQRRAKIREEQQEQIAAANARVEAANARLEEVKKYKK